MAHPPLLVEVVRSGVVESRHLVHAAGCDGAGELVVACGDVATAIFPRSSNKPMQAAAMVDRGLDLDGELLALGAASHSGEEFHVRGVRAILDSAGLDPGALRCPASLPLDEQAAQRVVASGGGPERIYMNCSGKHAAMLATCVAAGWPTADYTSPRHPLQEAIAARLERLAVERIAAVGVDGCGAPLFTLSLSAVTRAYHAMVLAPPGSPERAVADAMRAHPAWTSGTRRPERRLAAEVNGLLIKGGAEGVIAFALPDGCAGAVKVADGAQRAVIPAAVVVARRLGVDAPVLAELAGAPVYGGGEVVGGIRCAAEPDPDWMDSPIGGE